MADSIPLKVEPTQTSDREVPSSPESTTPSVTSLLPLWRQLSASAMEAEEKRNAHQLLAGQLFARHEAPLRTRMPRTGEERESSPSESAGTADVDGPVERRNREVAGTAPGGSPPLAREGDGPCEPVPPAPSQVDAVVIDDNPVLEASVSPVPSEEAQPKRGESPSAEAEASVSAGVAEGAATVKLAVQRLGHPHLNANELSAAAAALAAAQSASMETGDMDVDDADTDGKSKRSRGNRLRNELQDSAGFGHQWRTSHGDGEAAARALGLSMLSKSAVRGVTRRASRVAGEACVAAEIAASTGATDSNHRDGALPRACRAVRLASLALHPPC